MKSADDSKSDKVLLVAAEASSCMYAKNFIKKWQEHNPTTQFFGVGDHAMAADGMECLGFAEDMAVVGLQEVLKHYSAIKAVADQILDRVAKEKPRFALLLDYPGFNLRLAKKLKALDVPVVYYISPQLWAWKKGRVKQVKEYVDEMLVVFPFEVEFYKQYGVVAHFVGHPLVEVIEKELKRSDPAPHDQKVLGLMPGSRRSELQYNLETQLATAVQLRQQHSIRVRLLLAPTLTSSDVQEVVARFDLDVEVVKEPPTQMIQDCDLILTASGTATLQVALCEKPMVVMYRMNPITAFLAKRLVNTVDYFCIVNLIAGEEVVPELFQEKASPNRLAKELGLLLEDWDHRQKQVNRLKQIKAQLGQGHATENVVNFLLRRFP